MSFNFVFLIITFPTEETCENESYVYISSCKSYIFYNIALEAVCLQLHHNSKVTYRWSKAIKVINFKSKHSK